MEALIQTRAVVEEALRLYPPIIGITRTAMRRTELAGRTIEHKTMGLKAFDAHDLQQVTAAVDGSAALHGWPVDDSGGRVPPHNATIRHVANSPVGRSRVRGSGQRGGDPPHQLVQRP